VNVINESEAAKILKLPRQTLGYYRRNEQLKPGLVLGHRPTRATTLPYQYDADAVQAIADDPNGTIFKEGEERG
jgi:hypothetical protein